MAEFTDDYRTGALTLTLLATSMCLWIALTRAWFQKVGPWPIEPGRKVPWSPFEAVAFIVIVLLCVSALLQQFFDLSTVLPNSLWQVQVSLLSNAMGLILIPLILSLWCRCHLHDFGIRGHGLLTDLRFAVWGVLLAQVPVYLANYPLQSLRSAQPHAMLQLLRDSQNDPQILIWIAAAVVIMAPLIEELLFRVLLQGALEREISPRWAIVLTAAAFVSTHAVVDWLPLTPLALILGYVYYRRHSYLSVVVLHALFNAINLLCAVWSLRPVSTAS